MAAGSTPSSFKTQFRQDEPVGVHVVSEFIFCERAGLNAYLNSVEDRGWDTAILRLDYQPSYELQELERLLDEAARTCWHFAGAAALSFVLGLALGKFVHWSFYAAGVLGCIVVARFFLQELPTVRRLLADHRAARRGVADEPNPQLPHDEPIGWWSLRAAGFTSTPCTQLLIDKQMGIQGRPWRILRRGDLAIPAYVRQSDQQITDQQRARIAAYCHLIRENQGADAPYGIILDQGTFAGTAIKPNQNDLALIRRALRQIPGAFREYLRHGRMPPLPENESQCSGCHHGQPRLYNPRKSETVSLGVEVRAYRRKSPVTKKHYHSSCGDRFGWIPPHERAEELEL